MANSALFVLHVDEALEETNSSLSHIVGPIPLSRADPVRRFVRSRQRSVRGSQTGGACYAPLAASLRLPALGLGRGSPWLFQARLGAL